MRFGSCGNLTASGPDKTGIETIGLLKEYGYDYIELPLSEIMALSEPGREDIVERVASSGLKSEVVNNFFPRQLHLTGPDVSKDAVRRYYREALPLAKRLGAEVVVFGSPFAKSYPLGFDKKTAWEQLREWTAEVDGFCAEIGLRVVLEPIHSFESNLVNSFAEAVEMAESIHGTATDVLIDFYHMTRDGESLDALEQYGGKWLRHVHFACPFYPGEGERVFPLRDDEWDYGGFIDTLRGIRYDGRVSIEARTSDFARHAKTSIEVVRRLFDPRD